MNERLTTCPTCGAPARYHRSGQGAHWYEPVEQMTLILRTPDGIPPGWYVTVDHSTGDGPDTVVLHRREATIEDGRLRFSERKMYDRAALVTAGLCEPDTLPYQLAEDLLVVLERIARLRAKPAVRALDDTVETER